MPNGNTPNLKKTEQEWEELFQEYFFEYVDSEDPLGKIYPADEGKDDRLTAPGSHIALHIVIVQADNYIRTGGICSTERSLGVHRLECG